MSLKNLGFFLLMGIFSSFSARKLKYPGSARNLHSSARAGKVQIGLITNKYINDVQFKFLGVIFDPQPPLMSDFLGHIRLLALLHFVCKNWQ